MNIPLKEELLNRFTDFIKLKCVNRVIDLTDCKLGLSSMLVLSEILINNLQKIYDEKGQEKISKFFYNLNFFQIFSQTLKKLDFPLFKEKFTLFIKVSFIHFISF